MIERIPITPIGEYGKYFLASEAPGDEGPRNVRVVTVPQNNRGKDFTAGSDMSDDDMVPDAEPPAPGGDGDVAADPNAAPPPDDQTDFTATDAGAEGPPPADAGAPDAGADPNDPNAAPPDGEMAPDDQTDFTAGGEVDPNDPNAAPVDPNAAAAAPPPPPQGAGTDQDSTRQYKLYLEYMALYNSVDGYISTLEKIIKDTPEDNRIVNYCVKTLRDERNLIFDYVTIKFTENNYIQNLLFYEKLIALTQLTIKMLGNLSKTEK